MINNRIFGADIDERVKGILKARQAVAADPNPNQSIQVGSGSLFSPKDLLVNVNFPTVDGAQGYLSSKTPFTRLWTSVSLVENKTNVLQENRRFSMLSRSSLLGTRENSHDSRG